MKPNLGIIDSLIRLGIGIILFGIGLAFDSRWGLVGIYPMLAFLFRWSPLYQIFGINTYSEE